MTTTSPPPVKKAETFDFYEALRRAAAGKRVHKLTWEDKKWYAWFEGTLLKIHKPDDSTHHWIISIEDTQGEDWIEVDQAI